jgi:tetratricopeptide (TPR) repeat protein
LRRHRALVAEREDLLIEFVTLLNFFGFHQEALQLVTNRKFHPWEGGEGKVTGQYVVSLVELAKTLLGVAGPLNSDSKQNAQPAIEMLERARTYPENLGEGKLHGAQENHILFWLGVAHEKAGDSAAAKRFWKEASTGMQSPTPAVYYNDQNPETIFYQGLSLQKLGRKAEAMKRFQTLVNFGRKHLRDPIEIDYFAVSLPEFMVFDDDLNKRNELNCRYLIGLGLVGLGKPAGGLREFKNVLKLDPAHLSAQLHLNAASWTARATSTQQFRSQHSVHDHTA